MVQPLAFFVIAGEPSGDALGAALMAGLKTRVPDARFTGVGGPLMQAEGLTSLFGMHELSIMGIAEVLPKLPGLLARIRDTAAQVIATKPDVLITIDSPDFCLRVARKVRASNPVQRVVHYVAPSVWAWRPERAAKMAPTVDQVLCLLPFEPPFMEDAGMRADFVGHPVAGEDMPIYDDVSAFRSRHSIDSETKIVLALPGSRRGEVDRLASVFGSALKTYCATFPKTKIVVPTVAPLADRVRELTQSWPGSPLILSPGADVADFKAEKTSAFAAADLALAASGTVSLELAASDTPMVIAYDMNWISRRIIASKLLIDTVTLVNLVSETRSVPELLGKACTPEAIAEKLTEITLNPEAQRAAMQLTMERLGRGGLAPGLRAADAVLDGLSNG
jgi:lipid-A-disaccharide synthase